MLKPVKTPCIGVCSTGIGDSVCRGCKRFAHEIIDWNGYTHGQRFLIAQRLERFLATVVEAKIQVVDAQLLEQQMRYQQLRFNPEHNPHCWVYELLRAGASQINDLSIWGLRRQRQWLDTPLPEIRDAIEQDYYALSCAHYDRYIAPGLLIDEAIARQAKG